jgi:hypothetical protein
LKWKVLVYLYGHLLYCVAIWYFCVHLEYNIVIWYNFARFGILQQKNLAILLTAHKCPSVFYKL